MAWQRAAAEEQVAQVDRGASWAGGEGLVGERQAAGDEVVDQVPDVGRGEPADGRRGVGCSGECFGGGS